MKKFKVTFFDNDTLKTRIFKYVFKYDSINHSWVSSMNKTRFFCDPVEVVNRMAKFLRMPNEYVTIKCFS